MRPDVHRQMPPCKDCPNPRPKFGKLALTALAFVIIIALNRCGGGSSPSPAEIVQERCTRCHTLAPIESSSKTRDEWESTVYRMIQKGARLSDEEAREVIDYLYRTYGAK